MTFEVDSLNMILNSKSTLLKTKPINNEDFEIFTFDDKKQNIDTVEISSKDNKNKIATITIGTAIIGTIALATMFLTKGKVKPANANDVYAPFKIKDLKSIKNEIQDFLNKEFVAQTGIKEVPEVFFFPGCSGAGNATFFTNKIYINPEILISKDFCKLVDKAGKCIDDTDVLWQITGERKTIERIIQKGGLKDVDIVPLTREERLKTVKSTAVHEAFHCMQFQNMILHPQIGLERIIREIRECSSKLQKILLRKTAVIANKDWAPLLRSHEQLDPNSEIAKKAMEQYEALLEAARNKDPKRAYEIYKNLPTEIEAYQFERKFAITNGLLI